MQFDRQKLKFLIQYIAWKADRDDALSPAQLDRTLWLADTRAFASTGEPITGATYVREIDGPAPKASLPVRCELERENAIRVRRNGRSEWLSADNPPDMTPLTLAEIAIVDWCIEWIAAHDSAAQTGVRSHDYAWQIASVGEELPMVAALVTLLREPTEHELQWGREVGARLGLR